jgi:hypothetical protein
MLVKSLSRTAGTIGTASNGLVNYLFRYVLDKDKSRKHKDLFRGPDRPLVIRHLLKSRTMEGMIKEFIENEKFRLVKRKNRTLLHHSIISFSPDDRRYITEPMLRDIAKKYIELRCPTSLVLGSVHWEAHIHLHLVLSGCKINGRSNRVSKREHANISIALQDYQLSKYPELSASVVAHGKTVQKISKEALLETFKRSHQTKKIELQSVLETELKAACSRDDFYERLSRLGHQVYS